LSSNSVPGTNVPPISFPGISSGIDYNAIIQKLTSLTLSQNVQLNAQVATLNAANTELIKINNLIASVQTTLNDLSDPAIFHAYSATSSNPAEGSASITSGGTPVTGTYTILNSTQATATTITNSPTAGHSINFGANTTLPLADSDAAVTPSNGTSSTGQGTVTINGVQVSYNANSQSITTILTNITNQVKAATGDASFSATLSAVNGEVTISSGNHPVTLGSPSDTGNLLQVLKLSTAQVVNTATTGTVTGTSDVGGINQAAAFNSSTNAGYATAVTGGTFTINGVAFTLNTANDNTASVLARINASNAGVIASYDATTNKITLTASATGPQSIVLGAAGDSSNFLSAAGLTAASGGTTVVGGQSSVEVQGPSGTINTVYSNSNAVTTAIPGVTLNITNFSGPYSVTVAPDTSQLVSALNTFVSTYNIAITEINNATEPPAVITPQPGSSTTPTSQAVGGGVLWSNSNIINVKNSLTNLVSGFFGSGTSYNSLASIGLQLSSQFTVLSTSSSSGANSTTLDNPVSTQTLGGTDGTFQALNTTTLLNALQANPSAVQDIFQNASTGLSNQLGNYLGFVTGLPTLLNSGVVGQIQAGGVGLIQGFETANTDSITSIESQIQQITDNANQQANTLRQGFVSTEATLAQYQALQSQLAGFFKSSGT